MGLAVARGRSAGVRSLRLTVILGLAAGIIALAYVTEARARAGLLKQRGDELRAIVRLKVSDIAEWRSERIADARSLSEDPLLVQAVGAWLAGGAAAERGAAIRARLASVRNAYGYERISLLDARGEPRLTEPAPPPPPGEAVQWGSEGLPKTDVIFLDLRRSDPKQGISLGLVAPLRPVVSSGSLPIAFLVFRIDPNRFLYPLVQSWPTPSRSAETLLVRREGNEVVYLNELRHRTGAALTLRLPLTQPGLPAALAAQGREGVVDGTDYRGERVLAAMQRVPGSPWFLVSKIDREELLTPLARDRWLVALLALALLGLSAAGVQRLWRREREASDAQLRASEERYRALTETSPDEIFIIDAAGRFVYFNTRAAARFGGRDPTELVGRTLPELFPPSLGAVMEASVRRAAKTGQPVYVEREVRFPGGAAWLGAWLTPLEGDAFAGAVMGVARDITKRKMAEEALAREQRLLSDLIAAIPDNISFKDRNGRFIRINDATARWFGLGDAQAAVGKTDHDFFTEEHARQAYEDEQRVMATGEPLLGLEEKETWPDGTVTWVSTSKVPMRDAAGQIVGIVSISRDVTEHRRAEEELRESTRALLESQRVARLGSYRLRISSGTWDCSAILDEVFGIVDPAFRKDVAGWFSLVHPDQREEMAAYFAEEVLAKRQSFDRAYRIVRLSDGEGRWVHGLGELIADSEGRLVEMVGTIQDVTDRKLAEEKHAKAEEQLRQSQKLEAIGRLAGGVAHDFNNLLGVIMGYGDMVYRQVTGDQLKGKVEQILKAAERAAGLTRQLLAFGRKQVLQPKIIDLNAVVSETDKMLRRLIGEDVDLSTRLEPDLGSVKADPGQIAQVLMNLAVNARDAMPEGGRITIETRNADLDAEYAAAHEPTRPGPYVLLSVTDTGSGMDAATQAQIFEPFFSTKEVGKGTGLGLSTVYGIVKQSEGYIWVYSEVGVGTTFKIYLPRIDESASPAARSEDPTPIQRGSETVLLVEDEASLCDLLREGLEANGYSILVARDGAEAVQVAEAHSGPIHIMVTDVVMPGTTGPNAADLVARSRPAMKVLFISGYSEEAIVRHGLVGPGRAFLSKPFGPEVLLRRVRELLDAV
jgi:two-component system, cell cycle sensor histidine kinase and response regulator CckA